MRRKTAFKKWLLLALVVAVLSVSAPRAAHAQACVAASNGLGGAVEDVMRETIRPGLLAAAQDLNTGFGAGNPNSITGLFARGIQPVFDQLGRSIGGWFSTFYYYSLLPTMQSATRQLTALYNTRVLAAGHMTDIKQVIASNDVLTSEAVDDFRALRPGGNVCAAASTSQAMQRADKVARAFNVTAAREALWRSTNSYAPALNLGASEADADLSGAADRTGRWQKYTEVYCDRTFNNGASGCSSTVLTMLNQLLGIDLSTILSKDTMNALIDEQIPPEKKNIDINATNLVFSRDTIPIFGPRYAVPYTSPPTNDVLATGVEIGTTVLKGTGLQSDLTALRDLVVNLAEPEIKEPLTEDKSTGAHMLLLENRVYAARRQAVYDGLWHVIAGRVPSGLAEDQVTNLVRLMRGGNTLVKDDDSDVTEDDKKLVSANPSRTEILRAILTSRLQNGTLAASQVDEPENNARDLVIQQALQILQTNDQLDLMDHYAAVLAAQVGSEIAPLGAKTGNALDAAPVLGR